MSRAQVRSNVAQWIADAAITNLNQVFASHPKRINFEQNATAGQATRAAGMVFIAGETEERIAVGGANSGWKRIDYDVEFQIYCHSMQNYSQDAMDDFDAIIDAVKDRVRSGGHRLGQSDGSIIWQAGEGMKQISVTYSEPKTNDGGATEIWAAVAFEVTQMIQA
jgi:secreted trypsin-like serine protease